MPCAARRTGSARRSGPTPAMATGGGSWTVGPAPRGWRSRSCGKAATFGVAAGAAQTGRAGLGQRGRLELPARGVHPADGETGRTTRDHPAVEVSGQCDGPRPGRAGRRLPVPAAGRWPLPRLGRGRADMKVREGGRVVLVHVLTATGVTPTGTGRCSGST